MKKVTLWSSFVSERIQNSSILSQNISRWNGKTNFSIESFNNRYLLLHNYTILTVLLTYFGIYKYSKKSIAYFGIDIGSVWNIACVAVSRILATFDATISLCPKRHDVFCMKNPIVCQLFYLFPDDSSQRKDQ